MGKIGYALSILKRYELEEFKSYIKSVGKVLLCEEVERDDEIGYVYKNHDIFVSLFNGGDYIAGIVIHKVWAVGDNVLIEYSGARRLLQGEDAYFCAYSTNIDYIDDLYEEHMQVGTVALLHQACVKETGINSNTF